MSQDKDIEVLDLSKDEKIQTYTIGIKIKINKYLTLVEDYLNNLDIQRGKMIARKKDVYKRLIEDLKQGTVIPPISLAISQESKLLEKISQKSLERMNLKDIEEILNADLSPGDLNILDGLQRTYCFFNVKDDLQKKSANELNKFCNSKIRAEIWINISTNALLYKILVLNTGQVKMSLRHQIEILHMPLKEDIKNIAKIKHNKEISFSTYKEQKPAKGLYNYKFANVVEAFTSFSIGEYNIDKTSMVIEELNKMDILNELDRTQFDRKNIETIVEFLILLDEVLRKYYEKPLKSEEDEVILFSSRDELMNSSPFLSSFFAALGRNNKENKKDRIEHLKNYLNTLNATTAEEIQNDPLELAFMSKILIEKKERAKKWGEEQRRFFFSAFREFMLEESDNFINAWRNAEA